MEPGAILTLVLILAALIGFDLYLAFLLVIRRRGSGRRDASRRG